MCRIRPEQNSQQGIMFRLEEVVLDVLLEAKREGECIGYTEISRRAGIYREQGELKPPTCAIVWGVLHKLYGESRIKRCMQVVNKRGFELTDSEFNRRRKDEP